MQWERPPSRNCDASSFWKLSQFRCISASILSCLFGTCAKPFWNFSKYPAKIPIVEFPCFSQMSGRFWLKHPGISLSPHYTSIAPNCPPSFAISTPPPRDPICTPVYAYCVAGLSDHSSMNATLPSALSCILPALLHMSLMGGWRPLRPPC